METEIQNSGSLQNNHEGEAFRLLDWNCPICLKAKQQTLGSRGGTHQRQGLGINTTIVQCLKCSLLFPNPFPVAVDTQSLYGDPNSYFANPNAAGKVAANRIILQELSRRLGHNPKVLDVGSGCGELLVAARQEGLEATGLEVSDSMIGFARAQNGVELKKMTIEEAAANWPQAFDGVILNAVLEHVYNPDSMIEAASRLLKPGGLLYIDVPNEPNLLTRIGNGWNRLMGSSAVYNLSPTWEPYHVYGFNPKCLKVLTSKHGLSIESLKIFSYSKIASSGGLADKSRTWLANRLNAVANLTGTASNLSLWARKSHAPRSNQ